MRTGFAILAWAALVAAAVADDKPPDALSRKDVDARLYAQLRVVINTGVKVYDAGDPAGCYRLFQGGLLSAAAFLDHRPALQDRIVEGLAAAEKLRDPVDKAFALREVLDEVRSALKKDLGAKPAAESLWDRLGGEPAMKAVVHEALAAAAKDPKVDLSRGDKYELKDKELAALEKALVAMVSQVTGGPLKYEGKEMKKVHEGMKIKDEEFDAMVGHLSAALKKHKVSPTAAEELLAIVKGTKKDIVEKP